MTLPMPPQNLRFMGEDDAGFMAIGDGLVETIRALSNFKPDAAIVDIGSGYGRLAHALRRSGFEGNYHGLEILRPHTEWTQRNLGNERFSFSHLDIRNTRYNPGGTLQATDIKLQNFAAQCDVIVLTSVFTHMYQAEIENYFSCFPAMLRPGGHVVCTFFLLTADRRQTIADGHSKLPLPHALPPFARYHNASDPLHAIAFEQVWVEGLARRHGLSVKSVRYGHWCDGQPAPNHQYQDFVTLRGEI